MKKLLYLLLVICLFSQANAQNNKLSFGGSAVLDFPTSDFGDVANTGFGFVGFALYSVAPQIDLTATTGYVSFGSDFESVDFSDIPFVFGGRYYFTNKKVSPYAAADLGLHFLKVGYKTYKYVGFQLQETTASESKTKFGLGFGGGVKIDINKEFAFDANIKYYLVSDGEQIMIRLGVIKAFN